MPSLRPAWFNGAPEIKIKSDSLRIADTLAALVLFCRSELAREKPENPAFFLVSRIIVSDLRGPAPTGVRASFNDQVGYKAASLCF
ncbi:hypothetical protein TX23_18965 [Pseudomonas paralactis]|uniref:Uncharacterized protein n=1 Tax=Pseudomonas paralactis TaxID=1615673 RepID=A0A0R3AJ52_9PSED|nr:hypothetical protein TX23_18965 [Pseudomonas paralactis]